MTTKKRLYRSNHRIFAGVFGGIAEYFNIDPTIVRIIAIIVMFLTHILPFVIAYILLAIVIPARPNDYHEHQEGPYYHTQQQQHQKRKDVTPDRDDDEWSDF